MWGLLLLSALVLQADALCDGRARVPHEVFCDSYYDCTSGSAVEKQCPDGLVFNPSAASEYYYCQYPIDVDCSTRPQLQAALASEECPRRFGYFKGGGFDKCQLYINCVDGIPNHMQCPEGLAFNPNTYTCDWPDQVESCDAVAYLGFSCPAGSYENYAGADCSRYFTCVNGAPRLSSCPLGTGFHAGSGSCQPDPTCIHGIRPNPTQNASTTITPVPIQWKRIRPKPDFKKKSSTFKPAKPSPKPQEIDPTEGAVTKRTEKKKTSKKNGGSDESHI